MALHIEAASPTTPHAEDLGRGQSQDHVGRSIDQRRSPAKTSLHGLSPASRVSKFGRAGRSNQKSSTGRCTGSRGVEVLGVES
jgi:hypothetical protein